MLRTLIVEDEPLSRLYISALLAERFPDAEVVAATSTEEETLSAIAVHQPDVILMDIELQAGTGFGVLQRLEGSEAYIIFTTALDHHATTMLRLCGTPYISKPIDVESLVAVLEPARLQTARSGNAVAMQYLRAALQLGGKPLEMCIDGDDRLEYVPIADIVSICECSDGCRLSLQSGETRIARRTLKEFDELLKDFGFFRTHIHCIIARRHIVGSISGDGLTVRLSDGSTAPVSPKKLGALRAYLAESKEQP